MSNTAKKDKSLIPSIFYRGPENFVNIIGNSRTSYVFSRETDYTVTPVTWEDFYEVLLVDRYNVRDRLFVLSDDPSIATNLRRVAPEEVVISQDLYDAQAVVDTEVQKKSDIARLKNEYIGRINLRIAHGTLEEIPEKLEEDAQEFAETEYARLEAEQKALEVVIDEVVVTVEEPIVVTTPVVEAPVVPVVTDEISTVTPPVVDTLVVDTPVVDTLVIETSGTETLAPVTEPVVETVPVVETPVENAPVILETPVVTEPADVVPTVDPVVEAPVETQPETPVETTSEIIPEVIVETPVEETVVQTGPTTRKKSS